MAHYIDADRLRAEIEKVYKSEIAPWLSGVSATSAIYDYVLPLIDSLQQEQPEVDLEKEFNHYCFDFKDPDTGEDIPKNQISFNVEDALNVARHFYELGLNARKEENK